MQRNWIFAQGKQSFVQGWGHFFNESSETIRVEVLIFVNPVAD
jgi:hypothetical protein